MVDTNIFILLLSYKISTLANLAKYIFKKLKIKQVTDTKQKLLKY